MNLAGDPVRRLLDEGDALLAAGQGDQAILAFERVLLQDPAHGAARDGLERARALVVENDRRGEAHLDEAERALDAGRTGDARSHLDSARASGRASVRLLALADRLDGRSGRIASAPARDPGQPDVPAPRRPPHWSRRAFMATCALVLGTVTVAVAASWDDLMGRLTRAPRPSEASAPPTIGPPSSAAGQAVSDAQRRLEQGDPAGALQALERVRPEDPLYPYAQQLRAQSETARRGADAR